MADRKPKAQAESTTAVAEAPKPAEAAKPVELVNSDISKLTPVKDRKNRQTGTQIQLYKPAEANHTWVTRCATHDVNVHSAKRKTANDLRYKPTSWCEGCDRLVKARAEEAKQKAAQPTPAAEAK